MKILLTNAELIKRNKFYEVVYEGRIVFRDKCKDVCLSVALDKAKLRQLSGVNNVVVLRFG